MSTFLEQYEPLDVIGNGSFGIIRKVRRKSDGLIFARKELNFERMSERDRKQIVAEVNILKDLHHDHIVRYHDRYVDRDAGILYILMEYCGGGDLSTVIKQAMKQNRPISEDTIWNYFMQILLALHHCHHPNGHGRSGSGSGNGLMDGDSGSRRAQILHRDLKPDNVFLDECNTVKLGDFGLSKALGQASFANTYVGTPYYMSPELMQEKAYDSKSDIWSLGCLIYELCALKPPFHEAKTHSELSILIRNGRIPPLPRGYSQSLFGVIKAMLNLNPAMRPSSAQLLQHERLELVFKVSETEKMLSAVKSHKNNIVAKEREVHVREQAILDKEQHIASLFSQKDQEVASLQHLVAQLQQTSHITQHDVDVAVKHAVARREEELRVLVMKREEEVAAAMAKREEEIMEAVRHREAEICDAWVKREAEIHHEVEVGVKAVEERIDWITKKESELKEEEARLDDLREELEMKMKMIEETLTKGRFAKTPLEEVKNVLGPISRKLHETPSSVRRRKFDTQPPTPKPTPVMQAFPTLETPMTRPAYADFLPSAMKGVVLTTTGETLATPTPAELDKLFNSSPKVGLNFAKIFDFDDSLEHHGGFEHHESEDEAHSPPPSPSTRKERERREREREKEKEKGDDESSSDVTITGPASSSSSSSASVAAPPTRIRRPSIRTSAHRRTSTIPSSSSDPSGISSSSSSSQLQAKPLPHPHLQSTAATSTSSTRSISLQPIPRSQTSPEYDFSDEENLPSPFLRRVDRAEAAAAKGAPAIAASSVSTTGSVKAKKRPSSGNMLRAVAAANSVGRRGMTPTTSLNSIAPFVDGASTSAGADGATARPSVASARKASEEARKALSRP